MPQSGENGISARFIGGDFGTGWLCKIAQFFKNVGCGFDQFRALLDQFVAAAGDRRMNGTGNGEYFAPLFGSPTGSDQRATLRGGFDDQHAARQPGDDPVATRKVRGDGRRTERKFGNDGAAFGDGQRQFLVAGRINAVGASADHGDGFATGGQRATVGGGIDAEGETADNAQALAG